MWAAVLLSSGAILAACGEDVSHGTRDPSAEATPPGSATESSTNSAPAPERRARQPVDLSKRIWWNQEEVIESLGLDTAQRARMDRLFQAFVARDEERRARQRRTAEDYYLRLETGDYEGAREAVRELVAAGAEQIGDQPRMKIDVLSLLSPEQLDRFRARYPNLYRQPWLRRMQLGAPKGRTGRGPVDRVWRQRSPAGAAAPAGPGPAAGRQAAHP